MEKLNLINLQYGVAFGTIFNFMFFLSIPASKSPSVNFAIHFPIFIPFLFLLIYFVVDWLTANYLQDRIDLTPIRILSWSTSIWFLGSVIILTNSEGYFKYFWLSIYTVITGFYDLTSYGKEFNVREEISTIIWIFISSMKP